jgi:hypothetical protein
MSGYKRSHGDIESLSSDDYCQSKKSRVSISSNYLALANTIDARLDTLTRRIEHMLTQLNTRLGNLEAIVHTLTNTVDSMHVSISDSMSMVVNTIANGSPAKAMDTGSPMDTGHNVSDGRHSHASYYA